MIHSVVVAVAQANKKDQLQPVATGLFCNQSKLCTRKYMCSLCTVQTKVSTVLQDECLCGRAGVGGASGSGGHMHAGGETLVVVVASVHAEPCCHPPHCCCCSAT